MRNNYIAIFSYKAAAKSFNKTLKKPLQDMNKTFIRLHRFYCFTYVPTLHRTNFFDIFILTQKNENYLHTYFIVKA